MGSGDDIRQRRNDCRTTAANSAGILSGAYGVITNNGSIFSVTGAGSSVWKMKGAYGTLLNMGLIIAVPGSGCDPDESIGGWHYHCQ